MAVNPEGKYICDNCSIELDLQQERYAPFSILVKEIEKPLTAYLFCKKLCFTEWVEGFIND